jgi:hypothetical protein
MQKRIDPGKKIHLYLIIKIYDMPNWLRALIAGYGAKKLGGGCFSTILIFIVLYYALGQCNHPAAAPVQHGNIKVEQPARTAMVQPAPALHTASSK